MGSGCLTGLCCFHGDSNSREQYIRFPVCKTSMPYIKLFLPYILILEWRLVFDRKVLSFNEQCFILTLQFSAVPS